MHHMELSNFEAHAGIASNDYVWPLTGVVDFAERCTKLATEELEELPFTVLLRLACHSFSPRSAEELAYDPEYQRSASGEG